MLKNLTDDVARRMARVRKAAKGAQLARRSREELERSAGGR